MLFFHLLYQQRAREADLDDDDWANIRDRAINGGQRIRGARDSRALPESKADLIRYGKILISKGFTPLTHAAEYGDTRIIRFLVDEAGMDVNQRDFSRISTDSLGG